MQDIDDYFMMEMQNLEDDIEEEEWKTILDSIGNQKMAIWCLSLFKTHTGQNS